MAVVDSKHHPQQQLRQSTNQSGEPWLAAQNLAFLKRSSPDHKPRRRSGDPPGELASMPSLASSSEGSPGEAAAKASRNRPKAEEEGAQALLMAAMAMTEFGHSPEINAKRRLAGNKSSEPMSTPPKRRKLNL